MQDEPIQQATALLSTLLHCRRQAKELQACQRSDEGRLCERQEAAFVTCSKEHVGLVVEHLVKVADKFCQNETEAVHRCRRFRPGDDCEFEDMEAMRCASIHVLAAANLR